jgi:hypothetical protein
MFLPSLQGKKLWPKRTGFALAFVMLAPQTIAQRADSGPFAGLNGHWSGSGSATLANGSTERIHCRANYSANAGGISLSQQLRCASDSYRLEISANVVSTGGSLSGSWSEATHGQSGSISGHAAGGVIGAQAAGGGFSAGIGIRTQGNSQSVTITPSSGTEVRSVTITLHRG